MKFYKTLNVYKASNVQFNPETMEATSYAWWYFVKMINRRVVFNNYGYSPQTSRHQYKVRQLLRTLGIEIDIEIAAPRGLQDPHSALDYYDNKIIQLEKEIENPRSRKAVNIIRAKEIQELRQKRDVVIRLVGPKREDWREVA